MENHYETPRLAFEATRGQSPASPRSVLRQKRRNVGSPRLLVCVDGNDAAYSIVPHALAIACSLGLEPTFARVIDTLGHFRTPADPIEWQRSQQSQQQDLEVLAGEREPGLAADSVLLAGKPADELNDWALDHGVTLLAMGCRDAEPSTGLGSTARALLDQANHSLLLIPPTTEKDMTYRRVMVPIDGSARAESVLPVARRIARTHGATLVLVHVLPKPRMSDISHPSRGKMRGEIATLDEGCTRDHLEELRTRCIEDGVPVNTVTTGPGDPRSMLARTAKEQGADIIVMSSHGCTGRDDVPCGSVAEYLASNAPVPILIVRPNIECSFGPEPQSCRNTSAFRFS
ncbi:universal stress protein [Altererythrobacter sp. ZODW24]|uniref:universal stress protein n=1 Tax=Altererythrobacter sp. ZODW24 TaxID=2185142 RepID=UPI000DF854AE|nr:universal stress protein [Altererythrobacter sp. ZODW24]